MPINSRTKKLFVLFFIFTTFAWGGSFLGIHYAIEGFHPYFAAFLRVFTALIALSVVVIPKYKGQLKHPQWKFSMLIGLLNMGFAWGLLFWGERFVPPALAAIINSTVPLFVVILSPLLTPTDGMTWGKLWGTLFGLIGVSIIFYPEIDFTQMTQGFKGLLAILLMSVCYALGVLGNRRLSGKIPTDVNLFYQFISAAVFLMILSFASGEQLILQELSFKPVMAILYLGIISTAIAMLMFYWMIQNVGSVQSTAVTYLVPLVSIILDLLVLKKWISLNQGLGAVSILMALFCINTIKIPVRMLSRKVVYK